MGGVKIGKCYQNIAFALGKTQSTRQDQAPFDQRNLNTHQVPLGLFLLYFAGFEKGAK